MTNDQLTGLARAILAAIGGLFIQHGWIGGTTWEWLSGGIVTLIVAGWSFYNNRPASIAASAQALPGVNVQISANATQSVATAVANAKAQG